jgi:hypothetical protein
MMSKKLMKNFKNRLPWVDGLGAFFPKKQGKNCDQPRQKQVKCSLREKLASPPGNFGQILKILGRNLSLVLLCTVSVIVATFIFVWYTALKRNL